MYSLKDITVIINTFNSEDQIYSCLDSINRSVSVIIIENSANNNFKRKIESQYSNVYCELANKNLGYGKGNNLGLSMVKTRFALILNPDAQLKNDTLDNFLITAENMRDFAIIGPGIQEAKDTLEKKYNQKDIIETDNLKGFAMFLNLQQFKEIGFFDENFFIYFEEIDLCRRLRSKNKKIYLDHKILIDHIGGSSHNQEINNEMELSRNWHWMWSSFYYHKKHQGFIFAFFKMFLKLISSILRMIYYSLNYNRTKKKIYYHRFSGLINSIFGKSSWYRPKL